MFKLQYGGNTLDLMQRNNKTGIALIGIPILPIRQRLRLTNNEEGEQTNTLLIFPMELQ